jgi:hypothetical protein
VTDRHQDTEQDAGKSAATRSGRSWTERLTGPTRYRRFSDLDAGGRPSIFFKFELPHDQLPPAVYDILHELKYLDRDPADHEHGNRPCPTGLAFDRSKKHRHAWRLPDTPVGRTAADRIDAKLRDLAHHLEQEQGRDR